MTLFGRCLPIILQFEGGYVADPLDAGGATFRGITQRTYSEWRKTNGLPDAPVIQCTERETESIYYIDYWQSSGCDTMTAPVALVLFDTAVQHGVGKARQFLREVGPTIEALCDRRERYYRGIVALHPEQEKFLHGWLNRLKTLRDTATSWLNAPVPQPPFAA